MSPVLQRQRGVSLMGAVFVIIVLCVFGLLAMKIVPSYIEYKAIDAAILKARTATNEADARRAFDRAAMTDDITTLTAKDLQISVEGGAVTVSFAYQARLPLFGNASLVLDYAGTTKGR